MKLIHRKRYKKIHSLLSFSHKKSYIFQEKNYLVLKNGIQIIVTELSLGYLARIKIGDLNCHIYHFAVFPPKITKYQNPVLNNAEVLFCEQALWNARRNKLSSYYNTFCTVLHDDTTIQLEVTFLRHPVC